MAVSLLPSVSRAPAVVVVLERAAVSGGSGSMTTAGPRLTVVARDLPTMVSSGI
jgi:hypothetical protein